MMHLLTRSFLVKAGAHRAASNSWLCYCRDGTHKLRRCWVEIRDIILQFFSDYPVDSMRTRRAYRTQPVVAFRSFRNSLRRSIGHSSLKWCNFSVRIGRVYRAIPEAARRRYRDGGDLCPSELV